MPRFAPADAAVGILVALFACASARFAWQTGLASFADDSVSYLVMAQVFSPWQGVSQPVAEAFVREAFYPPLFPLLLGLIGAGHDIARAHAVTALLLAGWLPLAYALGARWLGGKWRAAAAALVIASLPAPWVLAKGILSEPLFGLLLLGAFFVVETDGNASRKRWSLAILLAALALTRSVGIVVAAGYGLWAVTRSGDSLSGRAKAALPALVAGAAYGLWMLARPASTPDDYLRIVVERSQSVLHADSALAAFALSLLRQARSMAEAWTGSLLLYWVEGSPARVALAGAAGVLALAGLAMRFIAGKADAWMAAAYLTTFLLWPFYDQMTRFLFPLLPILVLYAFWASAQLAVRLKRPAAAHGLLALLLLSLTAPALAFIYQRAHVAGRYIEMTDWYRTPNLEEARARAQVHLDLLADMEVIRKLTGPGDRIMWVTPSYIALLAGRRGVLAPAADLSPLAYRRAVVAANPDYIFLSEYHPRDTLSAAAWQAGTNALTGHTEVIRMRVRADGGGAQSLLLKALPLASREGKP